MRRGRRRGRRRRRRRRRRRMIRRGRRRRRRGRRRKRRGRRERRRKRRGRRREGKAKEKRRRRRNNNKKIYKCTTNSLSRFPCYFVSCTYSFHNLQVAPPVRPVNQYIYHTVLHNTVTLLLGHHLRPLGQDTIRPTQCPHTHTHTQTHTTAYIYTIYTKCTSSKLKF